MIYIDIKDEKTNKRIDTYLNFISVDHKIKQEQDTIHKQDIILCENNLKKIQKYYDAHNRLIIFNDKRRRLKNELFYDDSVYVCSAIEEIQFAFNSLHQKESIRNKKRLGFITAFGVALSALILCIYTMNLSPLFTKIIKTKEEKPSLSSLEDSMLINHTQEKEEIPRNIVFFGDSIIEGYKLENYYPDLPVINRGKAGYTTINLLNVVDTTVIPLHPGKVFLLIGTNDIAYTDLSNEEILNNIKEITSRIENSSKDTKIYIESIYPVKESITLAYDVLHIRKNDRIREINQSLEEICKERNYTYINLYDVLSNEDGTINMDYSYEGLHMNEEGYNVITKEIEKYVR